MFSPSVNITENDKSYQVELVAPGIDKKDFNLNVEDDRLTISYEHKEENEEKNDVKKFLRREFKSTSFSKSFTLPENVNADKISAAYQNGVLQVIIPKEKEKSKLSRLIKIS
ncbi:MAG: heat-shock protein Hsp20 [Bacteroidetes bacterium HGW-Bacteroidetes-4]|nr:MAG: heat-shock protein Hsp20 [Bacteroidetes bacterium HGW-Bacteroidetes-4]